MGKLWEQKYKTDEDVLAFTVGEDPELDTTLFYADVMASIAHVRGLARIKILSEREQGLLEQELRTLWKSTPDIRVQDEDCHTWIENKLVEKLGDLGKKIHTGRSRNDQVLAAMRLYTREFLLELLEQGLLLLDLLHTRAKEHSETPFPGRTHTQLAMPFSFGMLLDAWFEQYRDDIILIQHAYAQANRSPLGSAAGYGVPLPLDREYVAELLGFDSVQTNVLAVQNSRSRIEALVLQALEQFAITSARIAQDLILYSLPEFNYVTLPKELCTGSSIMPQKQNPDALELVRASAPVMHSLVERTVLLPLGLISGYHRDMQEGKKALMEGLHRANLMVSMMHRVGKGLIVNKEVLEQSLPAELFATDAAFTKVQEGVSFRDAYRMIAQDPALHGKEISFHDAKKLRSATGNFGNPPWDLRIQQLDELRTWFQAALDKHQRACTEMLHSKSIFS